MSKHYVLKVYAVEVMESDGRDENVVTVEFDGALKPKTKRDLELALSSGNYRIQQKQKVLA